MKFNKGDRVFSLALGWGVVADTRIQNVTYPVEVLFESQDEEDGEDETYTTEGRVNEHDLYPCLFTVSEVAQRFPEYKNRQRKDAWIAVSRSTGQCSDVCFDENTLREKLPERQIIKISVEVDS